MNKKQIIFIVILSVILVISFLIVKKDATLFHYNLKIAKMKEESLINNNYKMQENENSKQADNIPVNKENDSSSANNNDQNKYSNIKQLNLKEVESKLKQKESFILLLTGTTCPHCLNYKPVLNEVLKEYNLEVYELDVWALTKEEKEKLKQIFNVGGVPTTLFIVNGQEDETKRLVGNKPKETIIAYLKDNGYI